MRLIPWCIFTLSIVAQQVKAQNIVAVTSGTLGSSAISVKWYADPLVDPRGYLVYRQVKGDAQWMQVGAGKVIVSEKPSQADYSGDAQLRDYVTMASDPRNLRGIALIAILVKSINSEPFARFLGITVRDYDVREGKRYRYRVTRKSAASETEVGVSNWIVAGELRRIDAPAGLQVMKERRDIRLRWQPEPGRYYAVNVLRKINDTGTYRLITRNPVLVSKSGNKGGQVYPEFFYEDRNVPERSRVSYILEGVDFFGDPTLRSQPVTVQTGDDEAPSAVDSIQKRLIGRNVTLKWYKASREKDLAGYNIYRTTSNDTDYTRLNRRPLSPDTMRFTDRAETFGGYFYRVATVDHSGNERSSAPFFVNVFDNEPPAIPVKVRATGDSVLVRLTWKQNPEKDCGGYLVYRTVDADRPDSYVKLTPRPVECCVFNDTMPANIRNTILYKVVAVDESMNRSGYSEPARVSLPDMMPPSKPFARTAHYQSEGFARVDWLKNPETDLGDYEVFVKAVDDTLGKGSMIGEAKDTHFEDHKKRSPGAYAYWIVATDSAGNRSVPSNTVYVRWPAPRPQQLKQPELIVQYNPRRGEVRLSWERNGDDLRGYVVFRREQGGVCRPITGLLSSAPVRDGDVKRNDTYEYQVRAYAMNGAVARSEIVTIIIPSDDEKN